MSVIQTKSISGITSITTPSGSDNLLTIHTSDTTERFRVNNSGDVIVGTGVTLSPDGDVYTTGVTTATTFVGALTGNVTGNCSGGTIAGSTGTFTGDVDIADKIVHTGDTNTAIRFPTADTITAETGGSERVRIDSSGRLLVGATAKRNVLNQNGNSGGDSTTPLLYAEGLGDSKSLTIVSNNTNAWRGSVLGLARTRGTSLGASTIIAANDNVGQIVFAAADGTDTESNVATIRADVDGTPGANDTPGRLVFSTTADGAVVSTERVRIDSNGNVGVGVNNPSSFNSDGRNLVVGTGSGGQGISIYSANNNYGSIYFADGTSGSELYRGAVLYNHSSDFLRLDTAAGERLRITSGGSIGVNESSPDFSGFGSNGGGIELDDVNSSFTAVKISHGSADMYLASVGSAGYISTRTNHEIVVEKNSTEVARFNDNGIKFPSGKGIDFSSHPNAGGMSSELLDTYEEGSFTPNYNNGNVTYSAQYGFYIRVGNMVHCWFDMTVASINSQSGVPTLGGFPFAKFTRVGGSAYYYEGFTWWTLDASYTNNQPCAAGYFSNGATTANMYYGATPELHGGPSGGYWVHNQTGRISGQVNYSAQ